MQLCFHLSRFLSQHKSACWFSPGNLTRCSTEYKYHKYRARVAHWYAIQEPQRVLLGEISACYSSKSVNFLYPTHDTIINPFLPSFSHPPPSSAPPPPTAWLSSSSCSPPSAILFHKLFGVFVYACVCVCVWAFLLLPELRVLIYSAIHFGLFVRPP